MSKWNSNSNQTLLASKYDWLLGIPSFIDDEGEWIFTESGPADIREFMEYREQLQLSPELDFATYTLVSDIIATHTIVMNAMDKMFTSS